MTPEDEAKLLEALRRHQENFNLVGESIQKVCAAQDFLCRIIALMGQQTMTAETFSRVIDTALKQQKGENAAKEVVDTFLASMRAGA